MSIQRYDENRDSDIYLKFWFSIGHVGIPAALSHEFNYLTTSLTHSCIPLISLHVVSFYFLSFISMYSFPSVCSTHLFPFFHSIIHSFNSIPIHVMSSLVISIHVIPYPRLWRVNNLHDRSFGTQDMQTKKTTERTWLRCTKQIGVGLIWVQKKNIKEVNCGRNLL